MRIICFGPGPKFKGGISNYNTALAKAFDKIEDIEVHIVSWTQQYPSIIPREFIDKTSQTDFLEGTDIQVQYVLNYNNPFSWHRCYRAIVDLKPDIVVFQWAIAIQGIPLTRVAKNLKKHPSIEVLFDLHFVIQKEGSRLDNWFTKMALKHADHYIVHAYKTIDELKELFPNKEFNVSLDGKRTHKPTVIKLYHPIYDLFKPDPDFDVVSFKADTALAAHVFLFFGFIRKYKGLHYAIKAFAEVAKVRKDVSLLICGESFWKTLDESKWSTRIKKFLFGMAKKLFLQKKDNESNYRPLALIEELGLKDRVVLVNRFIANEEVHKYFQVSDAVVLYYEYATPSGIESLSYNFKKPLLATKVGHFEETIEDGFNGYLAEAEDINSMSEQMFRFLENPLSESNVESKTKSMSWRRYADAILNKSV
jgi:glycosyltransferase involved in cell wall biosynthesis